MKKNREVPKICFLLITACGESGKAISNAELTIIYNANTFSSLTACYLVRLDEQLFPGAVKIYLGPEWFSAPLKMARMPMLLTDPLQSSSN